MSIDQSKVAQLIAQIAIADIACVAALPLVIVPSRAPVAALGAIAIGAFAVALTLAVRFAGRRGWTRRLHRFSESREFALEMRISVLILCLLAAIAQATHVSVMLAGFALGVVLAMIGKPRRLARQLFGVTEGFLGPLFFVWLGASIDLGELVEHPDKILLGACRGCRPSHPRVSSASPSPPSPSESRHRRSPLARVPGSSSGLCSPSLSPPSPPGACGSRCRDSLRSMPQLLRIDSSADLRSSRTRALTAALTSAWSSRDGHTVVTRDLVQAPVPHLEAAAQHWPDADGAREQASDAAWRIQEELLGELLACDALVIGAPMYNYSMPSVLKAWVDHIHIPGVTAGSVRPLAGKPAVIVTASGLSYDAGSGREGWDHGTESLRIMLGESLGMNVTVVAASRTLAATDDERATATLEFDAATARCTELGASL
jgi:FMN-dependent NADH-azoreductase